MSQLRKAVLIFGSITLLKITCFLLLAHVGRAGPFVGDNAEEHYLPIAERLVAEGRFNGPDSRADSKVPIGYPAALAAVKLAVGRIDLPTVVCLQMGCDLCVAVLLFGLGRRLAAPRCGLAAGLAWLLFPPAIVISTWITAETAFTFLLTLSLSLLAGSLQRRRPTRTFTAGLVLGLACMFRGTCVWLPVFMLPFWWAQRRDGGWRHGAALAAGMCCLVVPWTVRNFVVLDDPILVSVGQGSVFLQGSDEKVFTIAGKKANYPIMYQEAETAGIVKRDGSRESEIDRWLFKVGLWNYECRLRERPLSFVPLMLHKLVRLWYGTESGGSRQQLFLALMSVAIVPAALWRLWSWRRRWPLEARFFGVVVGYFVLVHWITLPEYRYMHPLYPILLLGAACALGGRTEPAAVNPRALVTPVST